MNVFLSIATSGLIVGSIAACRQEPSEPINPVYTRSIRIAFVDSSGADLIGVGKRYSFEGWGFGEQLTSAVSRSPVTPTNDLYPDFYSIQHTYFTGNIPDVGLVQESVHDSFYIFYPDARIDTVSVVRTPADSGILNRNGKVYARLNIHNPTAPLIKFVQPY